jgi:hypothetical protein
MRAEVVVVVTPSAERLAHMGEAPEDFFIKELVPQASVEAFDESVLRRLAGRNIMPADAVLVLPFEHRATGELCPVVTDDCRWLPIRHQLPNSDGSLGSRRCYAAQWPRKPFRGSPAPLRPRQGRIGRTIGEFAPGALTP